MDNKKIDVNVSVIFKILTIFQLINDIQKEVNQ